MAKDIAVVLNSGSVNSAVVTALAAQKFRIVLLHAETGEPMPRSQRGAYDLQVAQYKPYREHTLAMPFLNAVQPAPAKVSATDPRQPAPLGPRMLNLLPLVAAAFRYAAHYQAAAVYAGLRVGNHPDTLAQATEYVQVWSELIQLPCNEPDLNFETPLLELEPWQVIDMGFGASTPFDKTWSCTEAGPEPCWACTGCRARDAAFQQAGKPDPLRTARKA